MSEAIRVVDNYKQQKKDYELHQALTGDLILNEYYKLKAKAIALSTVTKLTVEDKSITRITYDAHTEEQLSKIDSYIDTRINEIIREYAKVQFGYDTLFINYLNDFFNSRKGN